MKFGTNYIEEEYVDYGQEHVLPKVSKIIRLKTYLGSIAEPGKKAIESASTRRSYILKFESAFFKTIAYGAAVITALALIFILGQVTIKALPSLSLEYLLTSDSDHLTLGAGIANAIVGSFLLSAGSTAIAAPIAVGAAVYMKRYAKEGKMTNAFSFFVDVLSGTPSIVLGIFGLILLVIVLRPYTGGFSLISGIIALSILIMPVIERSTENSIDSVPKELEDASYSLGATRFDTVTRITLPTALGGILTGVVIGVGRAAEESAVVVLTAGYSQFMPEFTIRSKPGNLGGLKIYPFQDLVGSLPQCIYKSFEFPHNYSPASGFAAAFILILIVMFINLIARLILGRLKIG